MYCHECLCVLLIDGLNFGSLLARIDTVNRHLYFLLYSYLVNLCGSETLPTASAKGWKRMTRDSSVCNSRFVRLRTCIDLTIQPSQFKIKPFSAVQKRRKRESKRVLLSFQLKTDASKLQVVEKGWLIGVVFPVTSRPELSQYYCLCKKSQTTTWYVKEPGK